jgi:hypothetical protein
LVTTLLKVGGVASALLVIGTLLAKFTDRGRRVFVWLERKLRRRPPIPRTRLVAVPNEQVCIWSKVHGIPGNPAIHVSLDANFSVTNVTDKYALEFADMRLRRRIPGRVIPRHASQLVDGQGWELGPG